MAIAGASKTNVSDGNLEIRRTGICMARSGVTKRTAESGTSSKRIEWVGGRAQMVIDE